MKVVDQNGKLLESYDLAQGFLVDTRLLKDDAKEIDNVTKFAWDDDDYEEVKMFLPYHQSPVQKKTLEQRVSELEIQINEISTRKSEEMSK